MQRIRPFFLISLIGCVAMLAGCASDPWLISPTATPTAFTLPTRTPTPPTADQTPIPVAQAWGNVHITQWPITFGNATFSAGGMVDDAIVTDDDEVCGALWPVATNIPPDQLVESLALLNLHSGALTTLLTLPAGHLLMNCAATGPWIIWSDQFNYIGNALYADWRVMALNRQTREIRALDASKQSGPSTTPAPVSPFPVASNGKAVWLTDSANPTDQAVALYDFASKQTTITAHHATYPLLAWPWAAWGDTTSSTVVIMNLATQQRVTLNRKPALAGMAGDTFAITDPNYHSLTLYPADQFTAPYIVAQDLPIGENYVADPTLNDRLVTWNSTDAFFVFDRKLKRIVQFKDVTNTAPLVGSHFLFWAQQNATGKLVLSVIDTNTLP